MERKEEKGGKQACIILLLLKIHLNGSKINPDFTFKMQYFFKKKIV